MQRNKLCRFFFLQHFNDNSRPNILQATKKEAKKKPSKCPTVNIFLSVRQNDDYQKGEMVAWNAQSRKRNRDRSNNNILKLEMNARR